MLKYYVLCAFSLVLCFFITPACYRLAHKYDVMDIPTHRKVHKARMPLWGGLAIYSSFFITLAVYLLFSKTIWVILHYMHGVFGMKLFGIFIAGTFIMVMGMVDDKIGLPPKLKLFGQLVSACILIYSGIRIYGINIPFTNHYFYMPWIISAAITVFWIVLIINSINFVDGLDGLAAGVSAIAFITFFIIISYQLSHSRLLFTKYTLSLAMVLCAIGAGSCLGFLPFNFNPAKIFMGDTGSQFLGLLMAGITIIASIKGRAAMTILIPLFAIGLPIFDVVSAVIRRYKKGIPVSKPDKSHLHHRLLAAGFTPKQAVILLYLLSGLMGFLAVVISRKGG